MNTNNQTVLVTGASTGIGRSTALVLAQRGYDVDITYAHHQDHAQQTQQLIHELGQSCNIFQLDFLASAIDSQIAEISQHAGKYHHLVNNAGSVFEEGFTLDRDIWQQTFQVNLFGQVAFTNQMLQKTESLKSLVFTSSIYGMYQSTESDYLSYSASKAALNSLVIGLAKQLAPNIRVNAIAPGPTLTPIQGDLTETERIEIGQLQLINRMLNPEEIAEGIVFLIQNPAATGQILTVDGGMSLK